LFLGRHPLLLGWGRDWDVQGGRVIGAGIYMGGRGKDAERYWSDWLHC
jgi:hypothetical protein